jgi:hypothetical protein
MASGTTTHGYPYPLESDAFDVAADLNLLANAVETNLGSAALDLTPGLLSARPAASKSGRYYKATDTGLLYRDNGSSWEVVADLSRGKSIISTTESRSNTVYGTLTTPDQVAGIVLPTDGWLVVAFQATWQESVAGAGRAAVFIGSNQMVIGSSGPYTVAAATGGSTTAQDRPLFSHAAGLASVGTGSGHTDATTGQVVGGAPLNGDIPSWEIGGTVRGVTPGGAGYTPALGGPCYLFAAAGTYTISVQYKSTSGSVTVKNRRLWVSARGF